MPIPKITVLSETLRGEVFLLEKESYTIGRTNDCDICIPDKTISSLHCVLNKVNDVTYVVDDRGSTNGTLINGKEVKDPLSNGDILQIGSIELLYDNGIKNNVSTSVDSFSELDMESKVDIQLDAMKNVSPFADSKKKKIDKSKYIITGIVVILLIAIIFLIVTKIIPLFTEGT